MENLQDTIASYINGTLKGDALKSFEQTMQNDIDVQNEVLFQKSLAKAIELRSVKNTMAKARKSNKEDNHREHPNFQIVQNKIKEAKAKNQSTLRRKRRSKMILRGAVAASLLLLSLFAWNYSLKYDINSQIAELTKLTIDQDFTLLNKDKAIQQVGARTEMIAHRMAEIQKANIAGDYSEALKQINALEKSGLDTKALLYPRALAYANLNQNEKSLEILNKLIQEKDALEYDARYLAALLHIKSKNKAKAEEELHILKAKSEKYKIKAEKILKKHLIL